MELVRNCVRLAGVYTDDAEFAVAQHLLVAGQAIVAQAAAAQVLPAACARRALLRVSLSNPLYFLQSVSFSPLLPCSRNVHPPLMCR